MDLSKTVCICDEFLRKQGIVYAMSKSWCHGSQGHDPLAAPGTRWASNRILFIMYY